MTIQTRSEFIYGHIVNQNNRNIPFDEGGPELNAQLNIGTYSLTDYVVEASRALNAIGTQIYTVSIDRTTGLVTIDAPGVFNLLFGSGATIGTSNATLLGFDNVDVTGLNSYAGTSRSGSRFRPQFLLQDFIDFEDEQESSFAVVNESASGVTEVVTFGENKFMSCNITLQTNEPQSLHAVAIENDPNGISNLRDFLDTIKNKGDIEFVPDRNNPNIFTKCFLDSTPNSREGTGFRLNELTGRGLTGYFESGRLRFKQVTT